MPQFNLNKLVVLHLYNYSKPRGEQDPLSLIEKNCDVVKVSTCMRIIFILNSDSLLSEQQTAAYKSLTDFLDRKDMYSISIGFQRFDGDKAYEFLLYWMIGGVNPKKTLNDTRILGDVRSIWTKMLESPSLRAKNLVEIYLTLFNDLFTDSVNLNKLIPDYNHLELSTLVETFKIACQNCTWARVNGFLSVLTAFKYNHFTNNSYLHHLENDLSLMKNRILNKVELSATGTVVSFFKSKYEQSAENLKGIDARLKAINRLLDYLNSLKTQSAEQILSEHATLKEELTTEKTNDHVIMEIESSTKYERENPNGERSIVNSRCNM
ncbi:hypothetical protein [Legionella bononiensis]|uniref:Uncharacterized protein n=1 Tax=Legionella bononiensis TaxID=2793102 RepID=A0ABS1WAG8_9GAMM|nr:hypothetical protein [Legionella bononiensis]MBL7480413.1 hypothetical protein [Legionella bononiensis]MBL7526355.1 hypothetical protein [Legionella bononiensis]MBL7563152.1 hypothetical protein [Legionella bononiensis]